MTLTEYKNSKIQIKIILFRLFLHYLKTMNLQNSQTGFCLYISYNNRKKKIFLNIQTDFSTFLRHIKTDFNLLDTEILLFELDSEAEITSRQVLEPNSQLVIKIKEIYADNIMDNINPIIGLKV